jgi:hypothetical protein
MSPRQVFLVINFLNTETNWRRLLWTELGYTKGKAYTYSLGVQLYTHTYIYIYTHTHTHTYLKYLLYRTLWKLIHYCFMWIFRIHDRYLSLRLPESRDTILLPLHWEVWSWGACGWQREGLEERTVNTQCAVKPAVFLGECLLHWERPSEQLCVTHIRVPCLL